MDRFAAAVLLFRLDASSRVKFCEPISFQWRSAIARFWGGNAPVQLRAAAAANFRRNARVDGARSAVADRPAVDGDDRHGDGRGAGKEGLARAIGLLAGERPLLEAKPFGDDDVDAALRA